MPRHKKTPTEWFHRAVITQEKLPKLSIAEIVKVAATFMYVRYAQDSPLIKGVRGLLLRESPVI